MPTPLQKYNTVASPRLAKWGFAAAVLASLWVWTWRVGTVAGTDETTSPALAEAAKAPASLQHAYHQFLKLPLERQQRLLQFDQALREQDAATQARLLRLMVRYCEWLERLPAEERSWIEQASNDADKLARICEIKEKQWTRTLPWAEREMLLEARRRSPSEYHQLLERLRDREKQLELEWNLAAPPPEDQDLLRAVIARWVKQLKTHLTQDEWQWLMEIQKRARPAYLMLLAEASERHGVPIPQELHRSRLIYPPVPQSRLWQFLRSELDSVTRSEFEKRFRDPAERDLALADLVRAYWQAHRQELERFRQQELIRLRIKPKPAK